jgi:aminomethyltransferase
MTPTSVQKTPLHAAHVEAKAKMVPFGGWSMPVSYESVLTEHKWVRESCGIFDVSHMGEVRASGPDVLKFLQYVTINDASKLQIGQGQYSALLNDQGGMIDDLIMYRLGDKEYFICVNASNADKDFAWLKEQSKKFNVTVHNESPQWSQIAVQGPKSRAVLENALGCNLDHIAYTCIDQKKYLNQTIYVARTGYTGEWGYEVYLPNEIASTLWKSLLSNQAVKPIGLGARDTLRLEACYLLYGNDMNDAVSPLEAGIAWATKIDKGDFIGRTKLLEQKESGLKRKMIAFKMQEEGIPRHGMKVASTDDSVLGEVTSGSVLPTVGGAGGMALVASSVKEGDTFYIDIRGTKKLARAEKRPLYIAKVK